MIETARLLLRPWRDEDRAAFAEINGDPRVGDWLGGAIDRAASDALMDRIRADMADQGFGFWAAELRTDGRLAGMIGLRRVEFLAGGPTIEIGWRLHADVQGQGLATEGASAALAWGFANTGTPEIVAFTAQTNERSQAVMRRLGMRRAPERDFDHPRLADGHPLRRHVMFVADRPR